jgi:16S rRNA (uracil1498-N3)-methyltransferase
MRTIRSYIDAELAIGRQVDLGEQASAHLVRVLRRQVGDSVVLFNGDGHDYRARLVSVAKKAAVAEVVECSPVERESPLAITLVQALARGEKMDWVLQKATELGVAAIAPVISERTEVRLGAERAERRMAHWQGVIAAACEQSGRARVPALSEPRELAQHAAGAGRDGALRLALDPEGELGLADLPACSAMELVVGPEGGLSDRDLAMLRAAGYKGLRLGPRVLRTETAGPAAIAALQALHGDLSH